MYKVYESLPASDYKLWDAFKAGDRAAFAKLYELHAPTLYNYGRHISYDKPLIKDCIQELFIDLWKHKSTLTEVRSVKFYLLKAFRRKLVYEAKREGLFVSGEDQKPSAETITVSLPYEFPHVRAHLEKAQQQKLLDALEALPKRQREVIHLLFFDNFTRDEVASLMEIDLNSVYTLTWKALQSLKSKLLSANSFALSSSFLLLLALILLLA